MPPAFSSTRRLDFRLVGEELLHVYEVAHGGTAVRAVPGLLHVDEAPHDAVMVRCSSAPDHHRRPARARREQGAILGSSTSPAPAPASWLSAADDDDDEDEDDDEDDDEDEDEEASPLLLLLLLPSCRRSSFSAR